MLKPIPVVHMPCNAPSPPKTKGSMRCMLPFVFLKLCDAELPQMTANGGHYACAVRQTKETGRISIAHGGVQISPSLDTQEKE